MTGRELERIYRLRLAWQRCVGGDATLPIRVDEDGTLKVIAADPEQIEQLRATGPKLLARINAELERRDNGRFDRISSLNLFTVPRGVLELAHLTVDVQEYLRERNG